MCVPDCVCVCLFLVSVCLVAKYTGCVSLITKGVCGTSGAHTCSERHS